MQVIILYGNHSNRVRTGALAALGVVAAALLLLVAAYTLGFTSALVDAPLGRADAGYEDAIQVLQQQAEMDVIAADAAQQIEFWSNNVAALEARLLGLDALAKHVARASGMRVSELQHDGAGQATSSTPPTDSELGGRVDTVFTRMTRLQRRLHEREVAFAALDHAISLKRTYAQTMPSGRPVTKGWISSRFGPRTDPVTGRKAYHDGADFAGRYKAPVLAVAAGVVSMSATQRGYGNIVQLEHGSRLATRYAHNQKNLVKQGDTVRKGDVIALMGSTGRSTGTHVHFEVWRNGKAVDPMPYLQVQP